jgi:hypothetical protein
MPKWLPDRCRSDSIDEFRLTAPIRHLEGVTLAANGHRTGAVYLWGYAAEMTLKAAYFAVDGLAANDVILPKHLYQAIDKAKKQGIAWPDKLHYLPGWAELLVATRTTKPGLAYPAGFANEVIQCAQRIFQIWREFLRYHKNVAYEFEVTKVRENTEWLLTNSHNL